MKNILAIFTAIAVLTSCSSDDGTATATDASYSYAGPGSNWEFTYTGSTFQLKEAVASLEVNGSIETLASGFKKLTVTSASGTGAPSAGDAAYGLDVPGVVFLLKPLAANSEIIPMVVSGSCPSGDSTMNWVMTKVDDGADAASSTQEAVGTAKFNASSGGLLSKTALDNSNITSGVGEGTLSFSCDAGKGTVTGQAEMYLTAAGGAIVRTFGGDGSAGGTDDGIILAMPGAQSISSGAADGDFVGLAFTSNETYPIKATLSGSAISVQQIDPDTGNNAGSVSDTVNIAAFDSPSTGFVRGSLQSSANQKIMCTVNTNVASSGKSVIFCAGMDGDGAGGTADKLFNALLISK